MSQSGTGASIHNEDEGTNLERVDEYGDGIEGVLALIYVHYTRGN